eukprot:6193464-Pleurochrysis_carterae.AAC.3
MAKEAEQAQLLEELTQELAKPEDWIITPLDEPVTDQTLAMLAPKLCEDKHASAKHIAALMRFVHLCEDVDCLRKFSVLNYLAVTKVRNTPAPPDAPAGEISGFFFPSRSLQTPGLIPGASNMLAHTDFSQL